MHQQITKTMFQTAFHDCGRRNHFSYEGLSALYDWLEECNPDMELDVIALCCEYSEEPIKDVLENYNLDSIDELEQETCVIWKDEENVLYAVY